MPGADAFAALAGNLAEVVRAAGGGQALFHVGDMLRYLDEVAGEQRVFTAPCAAGLPGQG